MSRRWKDTGIAFLSVYGLTSLFWLAINGFQLFPTPLNVLAAKLGLSAIAGLLTYRHAVKP